MHLVQYQVLDCSDPILRLLHTHPGELVGRNYAGYLVFLFGAADEEFATWFTRNLVALDSLTGTDIGAVVFAARVRLALPGQKTKRTQTRDTVDLTRIYRHAFVSDRLIDHELRSLWRGTNDELVATTYATDDIARGLGVLEDLPCLVILDAVPSPEVEVVRLSEHATRELIPLIRDVVHTFRGGDGFQTYVSLLRNVQQVSGEYDELHREKQLVEQRLQEARRKVQYKLPKIPDEAKDALLDASVRRFSEALRGLPQADQQHLDQRIAKATELQPLLQTFNKTLWQLRRFATVDWPLTADRQRRYDAVCEKYVQTLIEGLRTFPATPQLTDCQDVIAALTKKQAAVIDELLGGLPTVPELQRRVSAQHEEFCGKQEEELQQLRSQEKELDAALDRALRQLAAAECPSLKETFRSAARARKITIMRRGAGQRVLEFGTGFLKPDILIRLWQLLSG